LAISLAYPGGEEGGILEKNIIGNPEEETGERLL